jgi:hypothetical protein
MGKRIDELSKQLAMGVSRRQMLKGALGGLAAAALATLIPGRSTSADPVNTSVLHCCQIACAEQLTINSTTFRQPYGICVQECYRESVQGYGPCRNCLEVNSSSLCLPL